MRPRRDHPGAVAARRLTRRSGRTRRGRSPAQRRHRRERVRRRWRAWARNGRPAPDTGADRRRPEPATGPRSASTVRCGRNRTRPWLPAEPAAAPGPLAADRRDRPGRGGRAGLDRAAGAVPVRRRPRDPAGCAVDGLARRRDRRADHRGRLGDRAGRRPPHRARRRDGAVCPARPQLRAPATARPRLLRARALRQDHDPDDDGRRRDVDVPADRAGHGRGERPDAGRDFGGPAGHRHFTGAVRTRRPARADRGDGDLPAGRVARIQRSA